MKKLLSILLGVVMALGLCSFAACSEDKGSPLSLSETELVMSVDDVYYLNVNEYNVDVAWSSTDAEVVSAQATANPSYACLMANGEGQATVTASVGGRSASCQVKVTLVKLTSQFEGNATTIDYGAGNTLKLEIGVSGSENKAIAFESRTPGIVSVTADGTVTAKRNGEGQIKVTHVETGANITVKINVINVPFIPAEDMPNHVYSGEHDVYHVQGITMDRGKGHIYYTFTNTLVKTDLEGNVLGTVKGYPGHMGDCTFNEQDGKLYATLQLSTGEYDWYGENKYYVAIVDVEKITQVDTPYDTEGLMKVVNMSDIFGYSQETLSTGFTGRYGITGLDGCQIGPKFGTSTGMNYLTVAAGVADTCVGGVNARTDNDYQIIFQYDITTWWDSLAKPLDVDEPPNQTVKADGEYFLLTGNGSYGIQDVCYDEYTKQWYFITYGITNADFYAYMYCFVVAADAAPVVGEIKGQPTAMQGNILQTVQKGTKHEVKNGVHAGSVIYSYDFYEACTGLVGIGDGYFYVAIACDSSITKQYCDVYKYQWTAGERGFEKVE